MFLQLNFDHNNYNRIVDSIARKKLELLDAEVQFQKKRLETAVALQNVNLSPVRREEILWEFKTVGSKLMMARDEVSDLEKEFSALGHGFSDIKNVTIQKVRGGDYT